MDISFVQLILVFIVGGIVGIASILDQSQIHRPLIACTLTGLVLGDITTGIMIGGALELLALGWNNIGAAVAPDAGIASVVSVILVIVGKLDQPTAIGLAIPLATAGQVLSIFLRSIMIFFQHGADRAAVDGEWKWIDFYSYISMFIYSLRIAIPAVIIAATAGTDTVQTALQNLPAWLTNGLGIAGGFIVVVGYAMIINMMRATHLMPFFFAGFTVAAFLSINLVGMGIIGVCIAMIYISLHPKFNGGVATAVATKRNKLDNQLD